MAPKIAEAALVMVVEGAGANNHNFNKTTFVVQLALV